MFRINIDLLEMCYARLEQLDVRESYGDTVCECYPRRAALLCIFQTAWVVVSAKADAGARPARSVAAASSTAVSSGRTWGRAATISYTG